MEGLTLYPIDYRTELARTRKATAGCDRATGGETGEYIAVTMPIQWPWPGLSQIANVRILEGTAVGSGGGTSPWNPKSFWAWFKAR